MDGDEFLLAWHARHPGATSLTFGDGATADGRSSYDLLVDAAARPDAAVLDLACGDGFLIERLAASPSRPRALAGLDMSPDELAAARARLGPDIPLHLGRAEALPFPDGALDAVTCHMALMLMGALDAVLAEGARVLRPGGTFVALVGAPDRDAGYQAVLDPLIRLQRGQGARLPPLGDPRTRAVESLAELFSPPRWQAVEIEDLHITLEDTPAGLCERMSLMYNVDLLSEDRLRLLHEESMSDWHNMADARGLVRAGLGARLVVATRGR